MDASVGTANAKNYFNNFFQDLGTISSGQSDAIQAFFEEVTSGDSQAASVLSSAVIYTSVAQGQNPMEVLTEFSKLPRGQLNDYLAMFLNLNRVGTSFLGINNQPMISKYVQRSILL